MLERSRIRIEQICHVSNELGQMGAFWEGWNQRSLDFGKVGDEEYFSHCRYSDCHQEGLALRSGPYLGTKGGLSKRGGRNKHLRDAIFFGVFGSGDGYQSAVERLDFNCFAHSSTPGPVIASRWSPSNWWTSRVPVTKLRQRPTVLG
jgi:hypothetical protein